NIYQELEDLCNRVALIEGGRIVDIVDMEDIRNPKNREYKIEFLDQQDYFTFIQLPYEFVQLKDELGQVTVKVPVDKVSQLIQDLSSRNIKFISENPYSLEKYFKENFERVIKKGEADDQ